MPAKKKTAKASEPFEKQLFKAADKLRKNIDAAEYKHVVLGLIFLKYISDAFEVYREKLKAGETEYGEGEYIDLEDRDFYGGAGVFWVPTEARWETIHASSKLPTIGKVLDTAMDAIERENASLKGVLPKIYAKENLDQATLGGLIDLIADTAIGDEAAKSKDLLGRVYEYFLGEFANAEGKKGGQFYTPKSIVRLMVEMIEPYKGRVYDPACGSGGMFVMSEKFVEEHGGGLDDLSLYGQESNQTTWKLSRMNLAIRGIDGSGIKWNAEGSFLKDEHRDLKADFIIANPPFNQDEWGVELLAGRRPLAIWHASEGQCQLRLDSAHALPHRAHGDLLSGAGQWFALFQSIRRGRNPTGTRQSQSGGLHRRLAQAALLQHGHSRLPLVLAPWPNPRGNALY